MTRIKHPAASLSATVLLAFSLTACGGGAPDDASTDDFCDAYGEMFTALLESEVDGPSEEQWENFQDKAAELEEVGTPDDVSDDVRNGFEVFTEAVADADYDDIKDSDGEIPGVSDDDNADAEKFLAYGTRTCPGAGFPTDLPTEQLSELSDLPTEDLTELSDLPTEDLSELTEDLSELTELTEDLSELTDIPTTTE